MRGKLFLPLVIGVMFVMTTVGVSLSAVSLPALNHVEMLRSCAGVNLVDPRDIVLDSAGNRYVSDPGAGRIFKFAPSGTTCLGSWLVSEPWGMDISTDDVIYVADKGTHRVRAYNTSGTQLRTWGGLGEGDSNLGSPVDVALSPTGDALYVSPGFNGVMKVFTTEGTFLRKWNISPNDEVGGIDVDSSGDVFVVQRGGLHQIQRYDPNGIPKGSFGSFGYTACKLNNASDLSIDSVNDRVWVANTWNDRVDVFTRSGSCVGTRFNPGVSNGNIEDPVAVVPTASGVMVAEVDNNRVQRYASVNPSGMTFTVIPKYRIVTYNKETPNFTGTIRDSLGRPIPSAPVQLRYYNAGWKVAGSNATTNAGGYYLTAYTKPWRNMTYQVYFKGEDGILPKASGSFLVKVRPQVNVGLSTYTLRLKKTQKISTKLYPNHSGKRSQIRLQKCNSTYSSCWQVAAWNVKYDSTSYAKVYWTPKDPKKQLGYYRAYVVFYGDTKKWHSYDSDHTYGQSGFAKFKVIK